MNQTIYQLKVTLKHISPPIWRRLQVPADTKLGKLHRILQEAMGWTDSHLHQFIVGRTYYGVPNPEFPGNTRNERTVRLDQVTSEGGAFLYEYDFGDGWQHEIKVEKVLQAEASVRYPEGAHGSEASATTPA